VYTELDFFPPCAYNLAYPVYLTVGAATQGKILLFMSAINSNGERETKSGGSGTWEGRSERDVRLKASGPMNMGARWVTEVVGVRIRSVTLFTCCCWHY